MSDKHTTKIWRNRNGQEELDAYWEAVYANVEALYQQLYDNRKVENGNTFPLADLHQIHSGWEAGRVWRRLGADRCGRLGVHSGVLVFPPGVNERRSKGWVSCPALHPEPIRSPLGLAPGGAPGA
jgi:hypothetical protein